MRTPSTAGFAGSFFAAVLAATASIGPAVSGEPSEAPAGPATTTLQTVAPADLKVGDLVRPTVGGPVMRVHAIKGDTAICDLRGHRGAHTTAEFPIAQLTLVGGPDRRQQPQLEPQPYRPCPADVIMPNGRHECLG